MFDTAGAREREYFAAFGCYLEEPESVENVFRIEDEGHRLYHLDEWYRLAMGPFMEPAPGLTRPYLVDRILPHMPKLWRWALEFWGYPFSTLLEASGKTALIDAIRWLDDGGWMPRRKAEWWLGLFNGDELRAFFQQPPASLFENDPSNEVWSREHPRLGFAHIVGLRHVLRV